jgi:endonuclease/exonuclease/phosphatase family metal-dependent hydrolase
VSLRLASYNVHGFVGTDGQRDVQRIAAAIVSMDAHGVGLQEVPFERGEHGELTPRCLLEQLPGYQAVCAPIERHDGLWHGNAFLTRYRIDRFEAINLSYSRREPRTALEVELSVDGQRCRVITTHLGLRPGERRYQVRTLLRHLAREPEVLTILLGDFNEWFLAGRPLRWLERYFGRGRALSTFPSRWPLLALDRIWVHPRSQLLESRVLRDAPYKIASDHLPLIAEVSWPTGTVLGLARSQ